MSFCFASMMLEWPFSETINFYEQLIDTRLKNGCCDENTYFCGIVYIIFDMFIQEFCQLS